MTLITHFRKVNLLVVLALLAALLVTAVGFMAAQSIDIDIEGTLGGDSAEGAHLIQSEGTAIACACGDPGGGGGCC
jgi:hypothetical protein